MKSNYKEKKNSNVHKAGDDSGDYSWQLTLHMGSLEHGGAHLCDKHHMFYSSQESCLNFHWNTAENKCTNK